MVFKSEKCPKPCWPNEAVAILLTSPQTCVSLLVMLVILRAFSHGADTYISVALDASLPLGSVNPVKPIQLLLVQVVSPFWLMSFVALNLPAFIGVWLEVGLWSQTTLPRLLLLLSKLLKDNDCRLTHKSSDKIK